MNDTAPARRATAKAQFESKADRTPPDVEAILEATTDSFLALLSALIATGEDHAGGVVVEIGDRSGRLNYFVSQD